VGWTDQSGLGRTRAGLDDLGSFGSRDEALVFLGEQLKMLIAHKVSPSELPTIGKDGSKRAKFRAAPRLAGFRSTRRVLNAVERYRICHAKNIAGLTANVNLSSVPKGTLPIVRGTLYAQFTFDHSLSR
jgi:hypothetical protein